MLSIKDIQYILGVHKYKSIVIAAKECNVSQPALTMQLKKIEKFFGYEIFRRRRSNITLTAQGEKFIKEISIIYDHYLKIEKIGQKKIELRVGIIPTVAPYILPRAAQAIKKEITNSIYFFEYKTAELLHLLQEQKLDCFIGGDTETISNCANLEAHYLYKEEFFLITPLTSSFSLDEALASDNIILLEEGNCVNDSIKDICGGRNNNSYFATSLEVIKSMVAMGNGCGIIPSYSLESSAPGIYNIFHFKPSRYRKIFLYYQNNHEAKNLITFFKELISRSLDKT